MSWFLPDSTVIPDLYATPADYVAWTGTDSPANILPILRACSTLVADGTEGDYYDVDPTTGLPSSARILAAFRDATCIQAAAWVALGIDPATGGVQTLSKGLQTQVKIGSAQIAYSDGTGSQVAAAQAAAYKGLVPDAVNLLRRNGLRSAGVWALG